MNDFLTAVIATLARFLGRMVAGITLNGSDPIAGRARIARLEKRAMCARLEWRAIDVCASEGGWLWNLAVRLGWIPLRPQCVPTYARRESDQWSNERDRR